MCLLDVFTVTSVAQGAVTLSASPGGAYFLGPEGSTVITPRKRQRVGSPAKLVRLDHEVREAAVEFPPQTTTINMEQSSEVTFDDSKWSKIDKSIFNLL